MHRRIPCVLYWVLGRGQVGGISRCGDLPRLMHPRVGFPVCNKREMTIFLKTRSRAQPSRLVLSVALSVIYELAREAPLVITRIRRRKKNFVNLRPFSPPLKRSV